ncbi:predicted protein [Histoplasma capsulatum G186AR]|uniref:Uncharacterized protein n=1 Tax=Ajellomyces capsulatus (strain G186AR / H82 / ATCC MYA-2454 / RMSCC 2432) TaxID=447093 RepID=C0P148_AJECG|nr:uncharacterized protein HCBG_09128 [Histoplasma capsulatum G186AR]EEH02684.1 predicted protein [Histoplasma capsulatum G186AR]
MDVQDVEHLIALLTEVNPQNELPRRAKIPLEDPFHDRLRNVLDAIASVLISQPKGEVIAVGMQSQQNGSEKGIILTLASNTGINNKTLEHARELISDLKALGDDFAEHRKIVEQETQISQIKSQQSELSRAESPEIDESKFSSHLRQKVHDFRAKVFLFALPKIYQRLHKRYQPTRSSRGFAFVNLTNRLDVHSNDSAKILWDASRVINWMFYSLPNNSESFPDHKTHLLIKGLRGLAELVRQLFQMETWLSDFSKIPSEIRPQGATSLLSDISKDVEKIPGFQLQTSFPGNTVQGKIHCECKLALHLVETSCSGLSALPYIGVSKLSCLACWEFLSSLRKIDHIFYVKGSHSKAYFPWKFPEVEMGNARLRQEERDQILNYLYSSLADTYKRRLEAEEWLRKMSDSTVGSDDGIPYKDLSFDEFDMPRISRRR